ncbi:MAG: CHAT domain-containing protein [Linnemannia gamsii]|nr:MAG: CHAT domain-containing protein [Linnemannia gamsii]
MSYQFRWDRCTRWKERKYNDLVRSLELGWEVVAITKDLSSKSNTSDALVATLSNLSFRLQRAYLCYVKDGSLPHATQVPNGEYLLDQAVDLLAESTAISKADPLSVLTNTLAFVSYIKDFPDEHRGDILGRSSTCLNRSVYSLEQLCVVAAEEDRRNNLSLFYGISRYAAAAHLQLKKCPFAALQILEKGRGIANATLQEENMNKQVLAEVNPDFARRYIDALQALKDNRFNNAPYHERSEPHGIILEARKKLLGMSDVFHPPKDLSVEEMMFLAEKEDIVLINITNLRSHAIIIRKESIHIVDLPDLDEEVLSEKSWEIQTRLAKETQDEHTFSELQNLLTEFFRHLWRNLVEPVLFSLGYTSSPTSSEIWPLIRWIPTGVLCLYPIHAAGLSLKKPGNNTMSRVISTYATSLSSLYHIRQRQVELGGATKQPGNEHAPDLENSSVLVISMPDTMDQQPLNLSPMEAAAIATMFPSTQVLTGSETRDILIELAAEPKIVHFSCHGIVDYDFPAQSLLLTSDWKTDPLTTARLQALSSKSSKAHSESRLAFLSACFAANGGIENQQDENIHLASSMQHAGFSNVVGSTWYVNEEAALAVVKGFYEKLGRKINGGHIDGRRVAEALHFAVLEYRETTRTPGNKGQGDPLYWAPFVCFTD